MRRASLGLVLAGLVGLSTDAHAQSWGSFASAFPAFPCQDGWMACLTGAGPVTPDLQQGLEADLRVSWFDLKATGSFSPFGEFSNYTQKGAATVASAEPAPVEPSVGDAYADVEDTPETIAAKKRMEEAEQASAASRQASDESRAAAAAAQAEAKQAEAEARRQREEEAAARKAADDAAKRAAAAAAQADASEKARLQAEAAEAKRKADESERQRQQAEAAAAAKAKAEEAARQKAAAEEKKRQEAEAAKAKAEADARAKLEAERTRQEEAKRVAAEQQRAQEEAARQKQEAEAQARAQQEAKSAQAAALAAAAQAAELKKQREAADKAKADADARAAAAAQSADADAKRRAAEEQARAEAESKRLAEEQRLAEEKRKAEEQRQADAKAKADAEAKAAEERRIAAEKAEEARKADEARKAEEQRVAAENARLAAEQAGKVVEPAPAAAAGGAGGCDLLALEPSAALGKLTTDQTACFENMIGTAPKMTDKKKVSVVLMNNAWAKGDKGEWERLVKRHLEDIDESDPDVAYKYALHLSKLGAGRASGAIKYAEVALENRTVWTGDTYTSRVFSLYKVRAASAQAMWQAAEEAHTAAPSDETRKKADDRRNITKVYAREWYEYAKSVGKDTATALQLCTSAAGTAAYCEN